MVENFSERITCDPEVISPPCPDPEIASPAPSTSAEWCDSNGNQIVVVYQVPGPDNSTCPPTPASGIATPVVVGYFDATGTFTPGPPPAGYGACGEIRDFELVTFCAIDADGELIQQVVVQYEYDENTGELIGTTVLNVDGTPFELPYDKLDVCPTIPEPTLLEVPACLVDTTDPGCDGTPVKVLQSVSTTPAGLIDQIVDAKIFDLNTLVEIPLPLAEGFELTYGECKPASNLYMAYFEGEAAPVVEPFNTFSVIKPPCCVITVTTDAGTITIPQGMESYCPAKFDCALTSIEIAIIEGDCTIDDVKLYVQHTGV